MEDTKKTLAEKMYKALDVSCSGEFDMGKDHDEFIEAFINVLHDYVLVPEATLIH